MSDCVWGILVDGGFLCLTLPQKHIEWPIVVRERERDIYNININSIDYDNTPTMSMVHYIFNHALSL